MGTASRVQGHDSQHLWGLALMMTKNGELWSLKVILWVPSEWWVVQVTNEVDGSYTPICGPFSIKANAEGALEQIDPPNPPGPVGQVDTVSLAVFDGEPGPAVGEVHEAGYQGTDEITADTRERRIDGMVDKLFN